MRAWRAREVGKPWEVLRLEDVEAPSPGPGEVVVAMEAAALHFADLLVCEGHYQERPNPPFVPGFEVVGTVAANGQGAALEPGTRVAGLTLPPEGSFQELVRVSAQHVHPIPKSLPIAEAAALHVAYGTALLALERRARLRPGDDLVVLGAAGTIGSAAVEIGRALGARVIAVAGGQAKADACRELGADTVIDHHTEDVAAAVMAATARQGADVVVDPVGGHLFEVLRRCLAFEARLVVLGFTSGIPTLQLNRPLLGNYDVCGLYFTRYAQRRPAVVADAHRRLLELYAAGAIRPRVRECIPFTELPRGLQSLTDREAYGRVILMSPKSEV